MIVIRCRSTFWSTTDRICEGSTAIQCSWKVFVSWWHCSHHNIIMDCPTHVFVVMLVWINPHCQFYRSVAHAIIIMCNVQYMIMIINGYVTATYLLHYAFYGYLFLIFMVILDCSLSMCSKNCFLENSMLCYDSSSLIHFMFTGSLDCIIPCTGVNLRVCMNVVQPKCTVFITSTVVDGNVLGLQLHSATPVTDSPSGTSSPSSSIHGKCPVKMYHFLCFIPHFYYPFLCLGMVR